MAEAMVPRQADVVIVGGGIVGAASAYYLAQRGVSVVLLERAEVGAEQSGRNWGFVRQQGRHPLEIPLAVESNRIWQSAETDLDADIEWTRGGNLGFALTEERLAQYEGWIEEARGLIDARIVTPDEIRGLIRGLKGDVLGGLHTPSDGHADPVKATRAFASAAEAAGATIVTGCAVDGIETSDGTVIGVSSERGEIAASTVVNAAGAWSSRLLSALGLRLPQRLVRATVQRTTPLPPITSAGVWAGGFSFRQRRDGRVILAGGRVQHDMTLASLPQLRRFLPNFWRNRELFRLRVGRPLLRDLADRMSRGERSRYPFRSAHATDPGPDQQLAERALQMFREWLPEAGAVESEQQWAGVIDSTPDAIPVIDALDSPRGLVVATGFSGHGFALGPIAGRLVSELIVDETPSLDLTGFRYARFAENALAEPRAVL
ncbi:MAG TPA: FAD-binding oxidoreductase [Dehalococcoidia bacterium]|jgi:glycine/D-amino acid oxidase-like deaminating enzyme|nr:FAD-binding oxidoreductase [Dehalococcoidia bacterium]